MLLCIFISGKNDDKQGYMYARAWIRPRAQLRAPICKTSCFSTQHWFANAPLLRYTYIVCLVIHKLWDWTLLPLPKQSRCNGFSPHFLQCVFISALCILFIFMPYRLFIVTSPWGTLWFYRWYLNRLFFVFSLYIDSRNAQHRWQKF